MFGQAEHRPPALLDRVGYLPEERGLYKKMQVRRVLLFLAELKGVTPKVAGQRIDEWLERFSLVGGDKNWGDAKVDELSRGMQQKVQFIAALLHDPDLVILDEPFSGLDPINAQALKDAVVELKRRGKTVIFSTHIMDNAEKMCDSVCIIARGEKVLDGTVAGVKQAAGARNIALALGGRWRTRRGCSRAPRHAARSEGGRQQQLLRVGARAERRLAGAAAPAHGDRREHRAVRARCSRHSIKSSSSVSAPRASRRG